MNNRPLSLDKFTESLISVSDYRHKIHDGEDLKYHKMVRSLKRIVKGELTERQKTCLWMYCVECKKMSDIACELGVGVSSVSRHIKKAKNRVRKTMGYYFKL